MPYIINSKARQRTQYHRVRVTPTRRYARLRTPQWHRVNAYVRVRVGKIKRGWQAGRQRQRNGGMCSGCVKSICKGTARVCAKARQRNVQHQSITKARHPNRAGINRTSGNNVTTTGRYMRHRGNNAFYSSGTIHQSPRQRMARARHHRYAVTHHTPPIIATRNRCRHQRVRRGHHRVPTCTAAATPAAITIIRHRRTTRNAVPQCCATGK